MTSHDEPDRRMIQTMKLAFVLSVLLVLSACALTAQGPTINPTGIEFTASANHADVTIDGKAIVTNYEFDAVAMNSLGAIALTINLGKPTPDATGKIVLPVTQLMTLTPNAVYTATVKAVGPGGQGVSAPSNPFGVLALVLPANPASVKVR